MAAKIKKPTCTSLVEEALRNKDDFMSKIQLVETTKLTRGQVSAAIHHLWRRCKIVDCIIETDGTSWWYTLSEDKDIRNYKVDERSEELCPRRIRQHKVLK